MEFRKMYVVRFDKPPRARSISMSNTHNVLMMVMMTLMLLFIDFYFFSFFSFQNCDKLSMRHLLTLKCSRAQSAVFSKRDNLKRYTSDEEDEEDEADGESQPSSPTLAHKPLATEGTSSAAEWIGITTNSEECSYSSADNSESQLEYSENNGCDWNDCVTPAVILNSNCAIGDRSEYCVNDLN